MHEAKNIASNITVIAGDRNILEAVAAVQRMSKQHNTPLTPATLKQAVAEAVTLSDMWAWRADILIRFEDLQNDMVAIVDALAASLFVGYTFDIDTIAAELSKSLQERQADWIVPGGWKDTLDSAIVEHIKKRHAGWFKRHGYEEPDFEGTAHE